MTTESDLIPTLSSRIRNKTNRTVPLEVVEFKAYKKKNKEIINEDENDDAEEDDNKKIIEKKIIEEVDMKKARFEIMKFGMKKMIGSEKEKTNEIIAVELGARPAKNKYINYKKLITERKNIKLEEKEKKKLFEINKKTIGKKSVKKISRNDTNKKKIIKNKVMRKRTGIIGQYGKPTIK